MGLVRFFSLYVSHELHFVSFFSLAFCHFIFAIVVSNSFVRSPPSRASLSVATRSSAAHAFRLLSYLCLTRVNFFESSCVLPLCLSRDVISLGRSVNAFFHHLTIRPFQHRSTSVHLQTPFPSIFYSFFFSLLALFSVATPVAFLPYANNPPFLMPMLVYSSRCLCAFFL